MNYTIYNPVTGIIESNITLPDDEIPHDRSYIEGYYSGGEFYIENGLPVAKPTYPTDGFVYDFDSATKTWQLNNVANQFRFRNNRNQLLAQIDRINPVWHASLTTQQQTELVAYRQQLLDVPQQEGFPTTIVWPAQPSWL
jgi:hypothetical protein